MSNVHMIGAPRKAGRRRERPLPDVPLAHVLSISQRLEQRNSETIMRLEMALEDIRRCLLMGIRAVEAWAPFPNEFTSPSQDDTSEGEIDRLKRDIGSAAYWVCLAAKNFSNNETRREAKR